MTYNLKLPHQNLNPMVMMTNRTHTHTHLPIAIIPEPTEHNESPHINFIITHVFYDVCTIYMHILYMFILLTIWSNPFAGQ